MPSCCIAGCSVSSSDKEKKPCIFFRVPKNGAVKIIDRKKHIFKLAQGEYIAPEKIENVYLTSHYVTQLYVHGESLKACLVAIVVPDQKVIKNWCNLNGIEGSWEEICKNKAIKKLILEDITDIGKKAGLKSFEQVREIHLHPELFSVDNGFFTPTMKTKRPVCAKFFKAQITEMYKNLD